VNKGERRRRRSWLPKHIYILAAFMLAALAKAGEF
jgi:hypothetical protein